MSVVDLKVNGVARRVDVADGTPLLYVLRNDLELSGPQFGCGLAQCGACSVLLDGKEARACITPPRPWRAGGDDARRPAGAVGEAEGAAARRRRRRRCIRCSRRGSTNRCRCAASARTA